MSDKSLVYEVTVKELTPIEGKDRIVLCSFVEMDWKVIVGKDEFQPGDPAVYVEVNTVLPECEKFEFLRKRCYSPKRQGFVIRTMKMGDVVSQGLALVYADFVGDDWKGEWEPMTDLTEYFKARAIDDEVPEIERMPRTRIEKLLSWIRWKVFGKKPVRKSRDFPTSLVHKTDETQVENLNYVYDSWKDKRFYATIKCDGSSLTVGLNVKRRFFVASRNTLIYEATLAKAMKDLNPKKADELKGDPYLYVVAKRDLPRKFKDRAMAGYVLQGELCGPSIQKNRLGLADYELYVFNAWDAKMKGYYSWSWLEAFCDSIGVETVPLIDYNEVFRFRDLEEIRSYADRNYPNGHPAEGVVFRLMPEDGRGNLFIPKPESKMSNMASFKCINTKFRLKVEG